MGPGYMTVIQCPSVQSSVGHVQCVFLCLGKLKGLVYCNVLNLFSCGFTDLNVTKVKLSLNG